MPLKSGVGIGIRPGHGKAANEFDELDKEDAEIARALEDKAQAGIPPGADHPRVVSHHNKAVKVSKEKAKLDLLFGEQREKFLAEMAAKRADGRLAAEEAEEDAAEAAEASKRLGEVGPGCSDVAEFQNK